jgi:predicted nucleic acid-binding protein
VEVTVLLDSVILIDHLNGIRAATNYLATQEGGAVSVITRAEVLAGVVSGGQDAVTRLLDSYPTLSLDREAADQAAELRRKYRWRLPDAFQAALAAIHGLKLATRNTRDFPPARHGFVIVPYVL